MSKETISAVRSDTRKRLEQAQATLIDIPGVPKGEVVDVVKSAVIERQKLLNRLDEIQAFLSVVSTPVKANG